MKIIYKNKKLELFAILITFLATMTVIATFILLYGFDHALLPPKILHTIQFVMFFIFLLEKIIRIFNAESKLEFLRGNWFEIPLLSIILLLYIGAGRWFAEAHRYEIILFTIDAYLVLQVISKICQGIVQLAATGKNPTLTLIGLFIFLIVTGAGLLMLPASHTMDGISITDAFFTATSATCVTGLIVVDTGSDFTQMGQFIILILIQLGGLGIVIFGAVLALLLGQALSMKEAVAMQDLLSAQTLSKISTMIGFIFLATLLIEAIGAIGLLPMWDNIPNQVIEPEQRWFYSMFHSVSAFCNAGFSLFKNSLVDYNSSAGVYTVIAPLIILGGLGFGVIYNIVQVIADRFRRFCRCKINPEFILQAGLPARLQLQTKIVLLTSFILIIAGTLALMLFEHFSPQITHDSRFKIALFQSITARTAGFNTIEIGDLSEGSKLIMIMLMFIGGSPGSTAGGIKTVTLTIVLMVIYATLSKRREVELFKRSVRLVVVGRAMTVMLLFGMLLIGITLLLVLTEHNNGWSLMDLWFEAASALGTVGLSTGVTQTLTTAGKWIIIIAMLIGRLGPLTLLAGLTFNLKPAGYDYPSEPLMVG